MFSNRPSHPWLRAIGTTAGIGAAYFVAARFALALSVKPEGVAVFWPAAGIAVGALITLGPGARSSVAIAVAVATAASNLMMGRNAWLAMTFGLVNAGQTLLTAWLIERRFGSSFKLEDVATVLGFLVATAVGAVVAATCAAAAMSVVHPTVSFVGVWRLWFASCSLGIVTVAPLLIGLGEALRDPPPRRELIEGMMALVALAVLSAFLISLPQGPWATALPVALVFPLLLWLAVRCRPVFAAAGAFVVALAVVWSTTFDIGHFGDASLPLTDRILAAQTLVLAGALLTIVLAALFAERRRNEMALETGNEQLKESSERLQLALGGAKLGTFSVDLDTGRLECDARAAQIHGHGAPPRTIKEERCFVYPDDLLRIDAAFAEAVRKGGAWSVEYRVVHPACQSHASEVRWVALDGSIVHNSENRPLRLLGVTRDVTEQKLAEEGLRAQAEAERRVLAKISAGVPLAEVLDELVRAVEERSDVEMMVSILFLDKEGKHLLHGAAPSLPKAYNDAIHGVAIGPAVGSCGTAAFRGEPVFVSDIEVDPLWVDYRALAMAHGLRACWSTPIKAVDGRVLGTFAIYYREARGPSLQDRESIAVITHTVALAIERHLSEQALRESRERLRLALDGAALGVWSVDLETGRFESDARHIRNHGHDPNAPPKTLAQARLCVDPDDLPGLDAAFAAAREAGGACKAEYRVRVPHAAHAGEERWIAVEGTVVRRADGAPMRLLGVTRDVTEQKLAEQSLRKQEEAFRRLLGTLPAAIYTTDAAGYITYCNPAAVDLWGATPELGKDKWCNLSRFYHVDGTPMPLDDCPTEILLKEGRVVRGREAILERLDGTRIPIVPYPTPLLDDAGAVVGVVNMTVDITERKRAELALSERNAQLALAGKAALVGSYAFDIGTGIMQISPGHAAIYGVPESTTEVIRDDWRARVHAEDLARLDAERRQAFAEHRREHFSEFRILRTGGEVRWIESRSLISYDNDGRASRMVGVNIDVTERKQAEDHKNLLIAELDHRVKNALACVAVIAQHARECSGSMDEFLEVLDGRIHSLANTHALLSRGRWQGVSLAEIVRCELAPCMDSGNTIVEGPDVVLAAEATQAVAMVLHELVTNAAKYGALSIPHGRISVRWDWRPNGSSRGRLALEWQEMGGPPVAAPTQSGYGTSVIRDLIPYELGGTAELVFAPGGVRCCLHIPVEWLSSGESGSLNEAASSRQRHAGRPAAPPQ